MITKKIAVAGKGGTGKTTLAGLIIHCLRKRALGPILAVDADPNANLGQVLGMGVTQSIGGICEEVKAAETFPGGMTRTQYLRFKAEEIVEEGGGFDLLTMGRPEGPGCYCQANNVLRSALANLSKNYRYCIIDNEAGLEHLSRKTSGAIDTLLVTSDPTVRGIQTARRIALLVKELTIPVGEEYLVLNRDRGESEGLLTEVEQSGFKLLGKVPEDETISRFDGSGRPLTELPAQSAALQAVEEMTERLIEH